MNKLHGIGGGGGGPPQRQEGGCISWWERGGGGVVYHPNVEAESNSQLRLERRGLFSPASLNFDVDIDQRNGGGCDAGDTRRLAQSLWNDVAELLLHFARQAAHGPIVEPIGNPSLLSFLQPVDGALLLIEISRVLDFSFDRLKFVANFGRQRKRRSIRRVISLKKFGHNIS